MRSLRLVAETDTVVVPSAIVVWTGEPTPNRRPVTSSLEQGREPPRAGKFRLGYAQARCGSPTSAEYGIGPRPEHGAPTMSILVRFTGAPTVTTQKYDETGRRLESAGDFPPDGLEYHVAFSSGGNFRVSEIWHRARGFLQPLWRCCSGSHMFTGVRKCRSTRRGWARRGLAWGRGELRHTRASFRLGAWPLKI